MSATALPSSGDVPERPAGNDKTCDARGMAEIHRLFRSGFAEAPALVSGVAEADSGHADVVGDHLAMLSVELHAHHEGEDTHLWGMLEQRAPSCAAHVERMKQHHAELLVHLKEMDAALPAWRTSGRARDADAVRSALDGINAALAVHLPDEEANIVPVMETTLTPKEVEWFADHGRKATPKGKSWETMGAILAAQPDGGVEWQRENLPAPARLLWRIVGKGRYEKNRKELTGGLAGGGSSSR
ncbi:hemerythrin domain-containing protein [Diaminobutyricibacter sp. McL0608]|uniref:hemerythrin domain-containing protein n=1 Tax=Leifsonia sp. McL0608 TaxID=3143537 RepID=UPI0031F32BD4